MSRLSTDTQTDGNVKIGLKSFRIRKNTYQMMMENYHHTDHDNKKTDHIFPLLSWKLLDALLESTGKSVPVIM